MIDLKIGKTMIYSGDILIDEIQIKTMSQSFDENGMRSGAVGEYIINKEMYYNYLTECRQQEDLFLNEMRRIEDQSLEVSSNENKE